jgi:type IV pilus assembly protein PilW
MSEKPMRQHALRRDKQMGYSLVEVSVAIVVALFLLAGMFSILQGTRNTSTNQNALAQLQDNERMAVTILTDVIQEAGYYPGADNRLPTDAFKPNAPFPIAGQVVTGAANASGPGETITVAYQPDSGGPTGCLGAVNDTTTYHTYQFLVKPETVGTNTVNTLECSVDGAASVALVSDVSSISFTYGVAAVGAATPATNTYVTAADLNTGSGAFDWSAVRSVKMTLTFPNPLYGQPGQTDSKSQFMQFTRVVAIQSKNGVDVN